MKYKRYKKLFKETVLSIPTEFNTDNPSDEEILRMAISAEQSAINLYLQLAKYTDNEDLKDVLLDVAREEKVHVGEFQGMLELVDYEEILTQEEGRDEIEEI